MTPDILISETGVIGSKGFKQIIVNNRKHIKKGYKKVKIMAILHIASSLRSMYKVKLIEMLKVSSLKIQTSFNKIERESI